MSDVTINKATIKPQSGFQVKFLSSTADIVIGGAAAGVGKSWCLLAAPLRHKDVNRFNCIIFRRTTEQVRNPGGLWDKSLEIYPIFRLKPSEQQIEWYNSKVTIKFSHLQHEKNIHDHDGPEYCLICWDELQHFSKKMFFYLLSRNRSTCGVRPYVLATCNPDPDSFVAELVEWWIDQYEKLPNGDKNPQWGYPIKERDGVLRYLVVHEDRYIWADSKEELIRDNPDLFNSEHLKDINPDDLIKSVTFISGSVFDNQELLSKNPGYLANLMSLDEAERLRLFMGNWKIRGKDNCIFGAMQIINIFDNAYPSGSLKSYITCDAARFGSDLATIFIWQGWRVVKLIVVTKCDQSELVKLIEAERTRYNVPKTQVIVDQDGVGGGVVKIGRYVGFQGNSPVMLDPGTRIKEDYENRNTQFGYRFAERVNNNEVLLSLNDGNIILDGYPGSKIKINGTVYDIRELIKQDLRAIRKIDPDEKGKKKLNPKVEQKRLCGGRSPDFYDGLKLRVHFEMKSCEIAVGNTAAIEKRGSRVSVLDRL